MLESTAGSRCPARAAARWSATSQPLREIIDSVPSSLDALPSTRGGEAARQTHDHVDNVRHGTTTLFAPLEVATGKISADACYPRHSNVEFLAFLRRVAKTHPRIHARQPTTPPTE